MIGFFDVLAGDVVQGVGVVGVECCYGDGYCCIWNVVEVGIDGFEWVIGGGFDLVFVYGDGCVYLFQCFDEVYVVLDVVVVYVFDLDWVVGDGFCCQEVGG